MDWIARLLGLFYLLGGLFALRQAHANAMLDKVMAAMTPDGDSRADRIAGAWMSVGAGLTLLSGALLLLLSRWAVPAFLLCWSCQAVYLLWARRQDDYGRPATVRAFVGYSAAAAAVVWWASAGVLG